MTVTAELVPVVYRQILERVYTMKAAPVWDALPDRAKAEFDQRLTAGELTWSDVTPADKQLIRKGEFEVSAGKGRLTSTAELGDWAAIDAALDSEDEDQLDAALFTVGHGFPKEPWLGSGGSLDDLQDVVEDPETDDDAELDEDDAPDVDSAAWVGL